MKRYSKLGYRPPTAESHDRCRSKPTNRPPANAGQWNHSTATGPSSTTSRRSSTRVNARCRRLSGSTRSSHRRAGPRGARGCRHRLRPRRLARRPVRPPEDSPGANWPYFHGWLHGQEEVSALPAIALDPQPGERVWDTCAAPGSKTTQLAALMEDTGESSQPTTTRASRRADQHASG